MTNTMWKTNFNEYLKFPGVKESIQVVKETKKEQKYLSSSELGRTVELTVAKILSEGEVLSVEQTRPQYDLAFGADMLVSYQKDEKNFSFFIDTTTSVYKNNVKYLNGAGEMVDDYEKAFAYTTEYFDVFFGIKERHHGFFFYEKPVVVMLIRNFQPTTGLLISHIVNISNLLISLNEMLVEKGYSGRASHMVRPNPKYYPAEFKAYKAENRKVRKGIATVVKKPVVKHVDLHLYTPLRYTSRGLNVAWKKAEDMGLLETIVVDLLIWASKEVNVYNGSEFKAYASVCNGAYQQYMMRHKGEKGAWKAFVTQHMGEQQ